MLAKDTKNKFNNNYILGENMHSNFNEQMMDINLCKEPLKSIIKII